MYGSREGSGESTRLSLRYSSMKSRALTHLCNGLNLPKHYMNPIHLCGLRGGVSFSYSRKGSSCQTLFVGFENNVVQKVLGRTSPKIIQFILIR